MSLARPSCELIKGANLYVSGLPKSMTQRELEAMFVSSGNIITSRILCDSQTGCVVLAAFVFMPHPGQTASIVIMFRDVQNRFFYFGSVFKRLTLR